MNSIKLLHRISILVPIFFSVSAYAQQRIEMEGTSITGNKESPNVLYIVPWKPTEKVDFPSPPVESIMDQPLVPLERNAFRRQIRYHAAIFPVSTDNQ